MQTLPEALHRLISTSLALFDAVIKEQAGDDFFQKLDALRHDMKSESKLNPESWSSLLAQTYHDLGAMNGSLQQNLVQSFTLMIELINACETAYRSYRLSRILPLSKPAGRNPILVFVLTAHPTEARSPTNIILFQKIQAYCLTYLKNPHQKQVLQDLKHALSLAWQTPVAKHQRPKVLDEAESIFSTVLQKDTLDALIEMRQEGTDIRIRTWVGGDKDGHPGIDERVMLQVMQCARKHYINIITQKIKNIHTDPTLKALSLLPLESSLSDCKRALQPLSKIQTEDGLHLQSFKDALQRLCDYYVERTGVLHPELRYLKTLMQLFPALIIPLELREDAQQIHAALAAKKPMAITRMLHSVAQLSQHNKTEHYVKGMVISMTESKKDITAGLTLIERVFQHKKVRVVPLFETESALKQSTSIMESIFKDPILLHHIQKHWHNQFEIMLGYSDSAKGMGALASRLCIAIEMRKLSALCEHYQVTPIFFHGSGGSIDRGGGSVSEQTSWWPQSAFNIYKTTIQGEMVERSFASKNILSSIVAKLLNEAQKPHEFSLKHSDTVLGFAESVSNYYQQQLQNPKFLDLVSKATSYQLLDKLKFGSRPAKRSQAISLQGIRAIPWVLCWTQTRILFPTWWGIGSAWHHCPLKVRNELHQAFTENPLFQSFIKLLGFTLAKVNLPIWGVYVRNSTLSREEGLTVLEQFNREYQWACDAVLSLSQQSDLLWFRPWLQESIALRSPFIHPLNLLQMHAIKDNNAHLIRETTTGIAAGMLTTG